MVFIILLLQSICRYFKCFILFCFLSFAGCCVYVCFLLAQALFSNRGCLHSAKTMEIAKEIEQKNNEDKKQIDMQR